MISITVDPSSLSRCSHFSTAAFLPDSYTGLQKTAESCFNLPLMWNHLSVGNISKILVINDKKVFYEFGITNKQLAESLFHAVLN